MSWRESCTVGSVGTGGGGIDDPLLVSDSWSGSGTLFTCLSAMGKPKFKEGMA